MEKECNLLASVRDDATHSAYANATDFYTDSRQKSYPLTYNGAGSLVSDAGRKIARIDYDYLNNPVRIQFTNGSVTRYVYSATGEKLRAVYQTAVPNISVALGGTRELALTEVQCTDSTDYLLGGALTLKNGRIDKWQHEEGYCQAVKYRLNASQDDFTFCYYDRDHLGSVRQVTRAGSANGKVIQKMDYYSFGLEFCDGSTGSNVQPHNYNSKELDQMHGLNTYDYGARQYDPVLARWDRMDPLCEKYYSTSPYVYCGNNPINAIDPTGCDSIYWNQNGNMISCYGNDKSQTHNYVIRTPSTTDEVYTKKNEQRGWCNSISQQEYDKTIEEIQSGNYSSSNIVYIGTSKRGRAMLGVIKDDGNGGETPINNREYFGEFNGDNIVNVGKSNVGIPGKLRPVSKSRGKINFHSHPSGQRKINVNGQEKTAYWIQPPSLQDIKTAKGTEYVIGAGNGLIYRYDKFGVNAIFPSSIFK